MMKFFSAIIFFSLIIHFPSSSQCVNDIYAGYGGISRDKGQTLITDSVQNVYFMGVFTDSIQLGAYSLTTDSIGQFICKMSPSGTVLWAKTLFNNVSDYFLFFPPIIRIDHSGQLVIAETCQATNTSFDTIANAFSNGDLYIARLNATTGALNSFVSTGRHMYTYIYDMDIDQNDNVYLAGSFVGVINFGSISMVCLGQTNSFLAKFDSQNQAQWARRITTSPNTTGNVAYSLDFDQYNHLFVSGWFGLNAGFGNGVTLNSPTYSNGFIAKYDIDGTIEWAKASDTSTTIMQQVVMDTSSVIVVQTSPARLINFNQDGDTIWTKTISTNTYNLFSDFKRFNSTFFGIGVFNNSINLDGVTYSAPGSNIFIACFNTVGSIDWVRIIQSTNAVPVNMAFDQQNNIYLVGEYGSNNLINQTITLPSSGGQDILYIQLCDGASSVNEDFTEISPIIIYPNPVMNELIIENRGNKELLFFEILNSLGQVVFNGQLIEKTIVQTSAFKPGVYLLKIKSGNTFELKKILKY